MAKKETIPFKVKIWPCSCNGEKLEQVYDITITSFTELPDKKKFWKMEILRYTQVTHGNG